jgi:hypothetical protein
MTILDLGKHRQARIWTGDVPDASYPPIDEMRRSVLAGRSAQDGFKLAAIEVLVPLGGRSMYGLLGGEFQPDSSNRLDVRVCLASAQGKLFSNNLAGLRDEVRVGLPAEYAEAVFDGVALAKGELGSLASGSLLINRAAHGAVGSCDIVFKHLSAALIKLLNAVQKPSDLELINLFPATFN